MSMVSKAGENNPWKRIYGLISQVMELDLSLADL